MRPVHRSTFKSGPKFSFGDNTYTKTETDLGDMELERLVLDRELHLRGQNYVDLFHVGLG